MTMETISRTLLTFLLNALWQVPLAWAVAALACRFMPNGPARHRHAVWVAALAAAFLLPALSVRAPRQAVTEIAMPAASPANSSGAVAGGAVASGHAAISFGAPLPGGPAI